MTEVAVRFLPMRCPQCGNELVSDSTDDYWRVCQDCEIVFLEPASCEAI